MIGQHPTDGYQRVLVGRRHRLWCFLLGFLYYASKGMWGTALLSLVTLNGLFVLFPLWNREMVRRHYRKRGWRIVGAARR